MSTEIAPDRSSHGHYDDVGNLLSIEVLDASPRVEEPRSVTFSMNGYHGPFNRRYRLNANSARQALKLWVRGQ